MILVWILSLYAAFWLGNHLREIAKKVEKLEEIVETRVYKKPPEEPESMLIDELDEVQTAVYEHEKMMRDLNGPKSSN
jgi:hypothetical protein